MKFSIMSKTVVLMAVVAASAVLLQWSTGMAAEPAKDMVKVVNVKCPLMGTKLEGGTVAPPMAREFMGMKIGLCCTDCLAKWDKMDDRAKMAELDKEGVMPPVVNATCPIMGTKLDQANVPFRLHREFKGQQIGVCCSDCVPMWDKMTDAEKQAALDKVMPKK